MPPKPQKPSPKYKKEVFNDPVDAGRRQSARATSRVVEFFDYRCPYCKQVEPSLESMLKQDPKLRLVYKEFPILGPVSITAAQAALAAQRQGKYDAFHAAMMGARGNITDDTVYRIAGSVGLDLDKLKHDMASPQIAQAIKGQSQSSPMRSTSMARRHLSSATRSCRAPSTSTR